MNKILKSIFWFFLFNSCANNTFYLNKDEFKIIPCGSKEIKSIEIKDTLGNYYFFHLFKGKKASSIDLRFPNEKFAIQNELGQELDFSLVPLMKYQIRNDTYGDATTQTIEFTTDISGHINYASSCNCD